MRLLKLLLGGLVVGVAVIAGFFAVAIIAASALALVLIRRLRGRPATTSVPPAAVPRATPAVAGEVIEITATEVPADRTTPVIPQ